MDYKAAYESWLQSDLIDEETKNELKAVGANEQEVKERFYKELEFGTGGLRGIIGAGTNRINIYTVGKATQGLANYIQKQGTQNKGVAIAYDCRNMSLEFAQTAAQVLAANGIKAYLYPELRPTPMLSFAVRELGCTAGIMVTASHNPPEYNGYKVYWEDGAQVSTPRDYDIIAEVNAIQQYEKIQKISLEQAKEQGLYEEISAEVDKKFDAWVKAQSLQPDLIRKHQNEITIVYTPLNGTGNLPVRRVLQEMGFENVFVVPEQELPDPTFRTVGYPNPEDPKVYGLAKALAEKVQADVILATDPDSDRIGVVCKNGDAGYQILSGNIVGALLAEYILSQKKEQGTLPKNGALIKTIVSTEMVRSMAEAYGVRLFDVLTGFKYIGKKMKEFEETGAYQYLFGFEESNGCLSGTYARDKDAVGAALLVCEMTTFYQSRGLNLCEAVDQLYQKYGYHADRTVSMTFPGLDGLEKIQKVMETFRANPLKSVLGIATEWVRDYEKKEFHNLLTEAVEPNGLPSSNVLHYTLEDGTWICIRPSGTEPKLKIYYEAKGEKRNETDEKICALQKAMEQKIQEILQ